MTTLTGLDAHLDALVDDHTLELPYNGHTYTVAPPPLPRQRQCENIWNARRIPDPAERLEAITAALDGDDFIDVTLGPDVAAQMTADGMPLVVAQELAMIALTAWIGGPEGVDRYVAARAKQRTATAPAPAKPKRRRPPKKDAD